MKVSEYIDEAVEKKMEEKLKKHAKDLVTERETKTTSDERESVKQFYLALASGDRAALAHSNEVVAKEYEARGIEWQEKAQDIGTIGSGTAGGVLVPTTVADSIVKQMFYISPIRQISTVIPNMPAQLQLPSENSLPTVYWVAEGATATDSGEVFAPNLLTPYKYMGLDGFTSEIIADAATNPAIQNFVEGRFAVAMALFENQAFANGSGSAQPYGFRSSAITPNSVAQAGSGLVYDDVLALKYSLPTAYRELAVYVTSSAGAKALEDVKDNYGRPIWRDGLAEATPPTLLGRPVHIVDEIPSNLGTGTNATEIWYGYFKNYFIGDRGALRVDYGTNGNDFANDKISLRMAKRVAAMPVIGTSFSKLTGVIAA